METKTETQESVVRKTLADKALEFLRGRDRASLFGEHGRYAPKEYETPKECSRSEDGYHCWHKTGRTRQVLDGDGYEYDYGVRIEKTRDENESRCCHCGDYKYEY